MFSVIIPVYNCEKTIKKVLDSVLNQTRFDLVEDIIIVNDGSTDMSDCIIKQYINSHKNICFKYKTQRNRGVSCARNCGIRMAAAEWIALLDGDDLWLRNKLERQAKVIQAFDEIKFLGTFYPVQFFWKKHMNGLYKITPRQLCIRNMPNTPSVVFHKETGIKLGLYNEKRKYGEDIEFYQKFFLVDSYYVLAENLVEVSFDKSFFAEKGLSSHLKEMHDGRNANTVQLYRMDLIGFPFLLCMLAVNQLKYARRLIENQINRYRQSGFFTLRKMKG